MKTVAILKNWDDFWITDAQFLSQTREGKGRQGNYQFQVGYDESCDHVIVLNRPTKPVTVNCGRDSIWGVIQEPPNEIYASMHRGQKAMGRVYNQLYSPDDGSRFILGHPMIPWFVKKSWQELAVADPPQKSGDLSCITSKTVFFRGHVKRQQFLNSLKELVPVELFGRGIRSVDDKWDALAPFKFSIILENFQNPYYWTEKIADCLLSWTIPIYYGCTRITEYFPEEAVIRFDVDDPDAPGKIKALVADEQQYFSRVEAVREARRRILEDYSFFSFMEKELEKAPQTSQDGPVTIRSVTPATLMAWSRAYFRRYQLKIRPAKI
jgi:hypothetical protein